MSFNQPFGAPEPAPVDTPADDAASTSINPVVLGAGALGGAALLGAAAWFLLLSGPADTTDGLAVGSAAPPVPAVSAPAAPSASATPEALPPTLAQGGRDPFKALVVEPVAAAIGPEGPGGTAMPGGTGVTTIPVPTGGTKPTPTGPVLNPTVPADSPPLTVVEESDDDDDAMIRSFGQTATWENGLSVTVAAPTSLTPGPDAIAAVEPHYRRFEVTVVNTGTTSYQPAGFTVLGLTGNGSTPTPVIDQAEGLVGNPTAEIAPGQTVTFALGYGTDMPERLALVVVPGIDYITAALFTNAPLSDIDPSYQAFAKAAA